MKPLKLRYSAKCISCGTQLVPGTMAMWNASAKEVTCMTCAEVTQEPVIDLGTAGASAAREHEKRARNRDERARERWPVAGGFLLRIKKEPQPQRAWAKGAAGEVTLGKRLDALRAEGMFVLHDRSVPGSRANIDHVVVAPSGIHVIDTKRYNGRPEIRNKGGILSRDDRLYVRGRDRTKLVQAMTKQAMTVDAAAGDLVMDPPTAITPVLCFVESDWPLLQGPLSMDGVRILTPRMLVKLVRREGPLDRERIERLGRRIAERLPPA